MIEEEEYQLLNYTEILVFNTLNEMQDQIEEICKCPQCRLEIASYALNRLRPMYVTSRKGEIYSKLEEYEVQVKADIVANITKAIDKVKKNPRHR